MRHGWTRDAANMAMDLLPVASRRGGTPGQHAQQLWHIVAAAGGFESDESVGDRALGDRALLADMLRAIAIDPEWVRWVGTFEQAESLLGRAERLVAAGGDRLARAQVARAIGQMYTNRKDYASAQAAFERALGLADGEDGAAIRSRLHNNIAITHERRGDWQASLESNDRTVATERGRRTEGNLLIIAHINRAECLLELGRPGEALDAVKSSRAAGAGTSAYRPSLLPLEARAALGAGDLPHAQRAVDEFRQYIADHGNEGPGAEWSDGIQDLQAQIDAVHRALINRTE
jgi:tetratricopeptide (TPR) repeat protein